MITDHIRNIGRYQQLKAYETEILTFLKKLEHLNLEEGRYELDGDRFFALVQRYETKEPEGARMESHRQYADLQYIFKGVEVIYVDLVENLHVYEDKTPEQDIIFYKKSELKGKSVLSEGMFGYYGTQDAHMPCIKYHSAGPVTKVVFKIKE